MVSFVSINPVNHWCSKGFMHFSMMVETTAIQEPSMSLSNLINNWGSWETEAHFVDSNDRKVLEDYEDPIGKFQFEMSKIRLNGKRAMEQFNTVRK